MEFGTKSELYERDKIGDVRKRFRLFITKVSGPPRQQCSGKAYGGVLKSSSPRTAYTCLKSIQRRLCWVKRRAEGCWAALCPG